MRSLVCSSLFVEGIVTPYHVRCAPSLLCFEVTLCAAIFCATNVSASQPPPVSTQPSTQMTAVVLPDGRYSKVAIREMGREAAHILKRSGVSLRWHIGEPAQAVSGLLVVVKLVGRCDMDGSPAALVPGPLGWAHKVNGAIIPFSDLACDNLRGAVGAAMSDGSEPRGNVLLG